MKADESASEEPTSGKAVKTAAAAASMFNAGREKWQEHREARKAEAKLAAQARRAEALEAAESAAAADKPLYEFTSHVEGKNAKVQIWADRIEWERKAVSGRKLAAGVVSLGVSLKVAGVRNKDTDMVPMAAVTSVTSKKGAGLNTVVTVHTAGGDVAFRVSHKEADSARGILNRLILAQGKGTVQVINQVPAAAQAPATPSPDLTEQLSKLAKLHEAGVLTDEEFSAKKAEILARL